MAPRVNYKLKAFIREQFGLQMNFATRVSLTEMQVSKIVCGRRQPTADEQQRIAEALDVEVETLFP
jgi:transcriptional regulator with XRE-family HTH domain